MDVGGGYFGGGVMEMSRWAATGIEWLRQIADSSNGRQCTVADGGERRKLQRTEADVGGRWRKEEEI